MGFSIRCHLKSSFLFKSYIKCIRSASALAHSKGSSPQEEFTNKERVEVKIDNKTIAKLEKISLVDFDNEGGIRRLEAAIKFAQKLKDLQIHPSIKPMYSVLENEILSLREDKVFEGNCRNKILKNAKILEDEYFIAPLGGSSKNC